MKMNSDNNYDSEEYNEVFILEPSGPIYYNGLNSEEDTYYDDKDHLIVRPGDAIDFRYEIIKRLGKGSFGKVYKAYDHKRNFEVALKIIRHERRFHKQVRLEIGFYELLYSPDKNYSQHVIPMYKWFIYKNDYFIVFELFGINMYEYYKTNNIPEHDVKSFTKQIALGIEFIHSHSIIHMDLKPENILIHDKHLKIIDLGSSFLEKPTMIKNYVQSRYYRSPEVVFELPIKTSMDIWSFGCVIYELAMGTPLIPARTQKELIVYYNHINNYPPTYMIDIYDNKNYKISNKILKNGKSLEPSGFVWIYSNVAFKQLVTNGCLCWDPDKRLTAKEILKHPFLLE